MIRWPQFILQIANTVPHTIFM